MHSDETFLTTLAAEPSDDVTRLVYADWLEERGDPASAAKAEFLRVTVRLAEDTRKAGKKKLRKRLQQLAAELDTGWLAVVSHLPIENCHGKRTEFQRRPLRQVRFDFLCGRRWEDLSPTKDRTVRACDTCQQKVHYCDTITVARQHARAGHCIAIDLGVIRRNGDLEIRSIRLGRVRPQTLRREGTEPDPVSVERERRKREQAAQIEDS
jgi:uncharacterized protein (TIGR02996 family)